MYALNEVFIHFHPCINKGTEVYFGQSVNNRDNILKEMVTFVKSVEESKEILLQDHAKVRELFGLEIQRLETKHMALEEGLNGLKGQQRATKNATTMAEASCKSGKQDNDGSCRQEVVERVTGLWKGVVELTSMGFSPVRKKTSSFWYSGKTNISINYLQCRLIRFYV